VHIATLPAQQGDRGILGIADEGDPRASRRVAAQLHVHGTIDEAPSPPRRCDLGRSPDCVHRGRCDYRLILLGQRQRAVEQLGRHRVAADRDDYPDLPGERPQSPDQRSDVTGRTTPTLIG
jgi:hypothetical protein